MTEAFISSYVQKRSKELGWPDFSLRLRQFNLDMGSSFELESYTDFYVLLGQPEDISIESDSGAFDLGDTAISEQQHEHSGTINITNLGNCAKSISLVQVTQTS